MRSDTGVGLGSDLWATCSRSPIISPGHGPGWSWPTASPASLPPPPLSLHGTELPSVLCPPGFSPSVHTFAQAVPLEKEREPLGKSAPVRTKTVQGPRAAMRASAHLPPALSPRTPFPWGFFVVFLDIKPFPLIFFGVCKKFASACA